MKFNTSARATVWRRDHWYARRVQALDRPEFTSPLYSQAEAARIAGVHPGTFRNWAHGYTYRTSDSGEVVARPLITLAESARQVRVPFIGLAQAYVLHALREAGVPMTRIRPSVESLEREMGLDYALLSDRLKTDGVEVLFDYLGDDLEGADNRVGMAVPRNKQLVFRDVIAEYLSTVTYDGGYATRFRPLTYADRLVVVDPFLNGGQPSFQTNGVRVADVSSRLHAGEALADVAEDFGISPAEIQSVLGRD